MREILTDREVEILMCFADCNMRTNIAARTLGCHRTTVPRAINKIFKKTGYNPAEFWDLKEIISQLEKEDISA